jgi:hypothetical protein
MTVVARTGRVEVKKETKNNRLAGVEGKRLLVMLENGATPD